MRNKLLLLITIIITLFIGINVEAKTEIGKCNYYGLDGTMSVTIYSDHNKIDYSASKAGYSSSNVPYLNDEQQNRLQIDKICYKVLGVKNGLFANNTYALRDNTSDIPENCSDHIYYLDSVSSEMKDPKTEPLLDGTSPAPVSLTECIYKTDRFYFKIDSNGNTSFLNTSGAWNSVALTTSDYRSAIKIYDVMANNGDDVNLKVKKRNDLNFLISMDGTCSDDLYYNYDSESGNFRLYTLSYGAGWGTKANRQTGEPKINSSTSLENPSTSSDSCIYDYIYDLKLSGEDVTFMISRSATDTINTFKVKYKGEYGSGKLADLYGTTASGIKVEYSRNGIPDNTLFTIDYSLWKYITDNMDSNKCLNLKNMPTLTAIKDLDSINVVVISAKPSEEHRYNSELDPTKAGEQAEYTCEGLIGENVLNFLTVVFHLIQIVGPIIALVLGMYDLFMAMVNGEDDAKKKALKKLKGRIIAAVLLLILPYVLDILLHLVGRDASNCIPH